MNLFNWKYLYLLKQVIDINNFLDEWANEIIVHSKNIGILVFDDEDAENITEIALIIGRHWLDYSRKKYPNKPNDYLRKKGIKLLI